MAVVLPDDIGSGGNSATSSNGKFMFRSSDLNILAAKGFSNHGSSDTQDIYFTLEDYGYSGESFTYAKKNSDLYPWSYGSFSPTAPQYYYKDEDGKDQLISFVPKGYAPDPKQPYSFDSFNAIENADGISTYVDTDNEIGYISLSNTGNYELIWDNNEIKIKRGSKTISVPNSKGSSIVLVDLVGAGGGGGGTDKDGWGSNYSTGGGGGSGAFCSIAIDLAAIVSCEILLGKGGEGGLGNTEDAKGEAGGSSYIGIYASEGYYYTLVCQGGAGGTSGWGGDKGSGGGPGVLSTAGNWTDGYALSDVGKVVGRWVAKSAGSTGGAGKYGDSSEGNPGGNFTFSNTYSYIGLLDPDIKKDPAKAGCRGGQNAAAGGGASFFSSTSGYRGAGGQGASSGSEGSGNAGGNGFCLIHYTYQDEENS